MLPRIPLEVKRRLNRKASAEESGMRLHLGRVLKAIMTESKDPKP